jgi:phosphate transport system substrate-binding protein
MHPLFSPRRLGRVASLATLALAAVAAVLPASASARPNAADVVLNGAGATFPAPLYTRWFSDYYWLSSERVQINYQAIGSGGGIAQVTAGTVDFGASDGILTADQQAAASDVMMIPMTSGAVAVVYNEADLGPGLWLTPDLLADIFLGTATTWDDPRIHALNPGLPLTNEAITVVHRSDGSGTTNIFTNYLTKVSPAWAARVGTANSVNWPAGIGSQGNAGVAGSVEQIPGAIGYVEYAYAVSNGLNYATLQNASGNFIAPSLYSTTAASAGVAIPDDTRVMLTNSANPDAYPIVGFTWLLVYRHYDRTTGETLVDFLNWAIHDGQNVTWELQYAPLSPEVVAKAEALIAQIQY